jgi:PAS domain S-box-containing protein
MDPGAPRPADERETDDAAARAILEAMSDGYFSLGRDWRFAYLNEPAAAILRRPREELVGRDIWECFPDAVGSAFQRVYERVMAERTPSTFVEYYAPYDGWYEIDVRPSATGLAVFVRDVTERERGERERAATVELLGVVNAAPGTRALLEAALDFFQRQSGCAAVAVRLVEGEDAPYVAARGFPEGAVVFGDHPCRSDDAAPDTAAGSGARCVCRAVLSGRADPHGRWLTEHGSFWTNHAGRADAAAPEPGAPAPPRAHGRPPGHESVALVPLRAGTRTVGLLHLSDPRPGRFTPGRIALWEQLARHLAAGVERLRAAEALAASEDRLRLALLAGGLAPWEVDLDSGAIDLSERVCELLGVADPAALRSAEDVRRHVLPEDWPIARAAFEAARREGTLRVEVRVRRADDAELRWLSVEGVVHRAGLRDRMIGTARDVTAPRRDREELRTAAETARRRAEELEVLMDLVPAAIWVAHDPQCRVITGNRTANAFYEAAPGENVSAGALDGEPDSTRRFLYRGRELDPSELPMQVAAARGEEVRDALLDVVRPSGEWLTMLGNATPLRAADGRVRGAIAAFVDITARHRAERALAEGERRLRIALEAAHMGTFDLDVASGRVSRTGATDELLGVDPDDPGPPLEIFLEHLHPEDRERVAAAIARTAQEGTPLDLEYRTLPPDGGLRWVMARGEAVRDEAGRLARLVGALVDVTDARTLRAALAASEAEARRGLAEIGAVYDAAPIGIAIFDTALRYVRVNERLAAVNGLPAAAHVGRTLSDVVPVIGAQLEPVMRRLLATGEPLSGLEIRGTTPARADERFWSVTWFPLRDPGGVVFGVGATVEDVTDQRRAEEALREWNATLETRVAERTAQVERQAEQLRALASEVLQAERRERVRLAAILHDHLQQLLVAARMRLDTGLRRSDPAAARADLQAVPALLREAIAASRSLAVELSPPALQEAGLLGGLNWLAGHLAQKHGVTVQVTGDRSAEPETEELRYLAFECIRELLFNVVKHAGVSEAAVTVARAADDRVVVTVRDAGQGFDTLTLRERCPSDVTFGLFSIQQRLAHVRGELLLDSAPGAGTTATLRLPGAPGRPTPGHTAAPGAAPTPRSVGEGGGGPVLRVLLVDDHRVLREGLGGLLRLEPDLAVVGEAADGPSAIEQATRLRPDVIVMDVNLGEMSGVEATRAIRAVLPDVRVVGLSMHVDPDVAEAMRAAGAAAYVTKGGPAQDLFDAIRGCAGAGG